MQASVFRDVVIRKCLRKMDLSYIIPNVTFVPQNDNDRVQYYSDSIIDDDKCMFYGSINDVYYDGYYDVLNDDCDGKAASAGSAQAQLVLSFLIPSFANAQCWH